MSPCLSIQSTPIISGEDLGDMETRGKELATRCWDENEGFLAKEKIAEWLGGQYVFFSAKVSFFGPGDLYITSAQINKVALRYYVDFFDFAGLRLDLAFRSV